MAGAWLSGAVRIRADGDGGRMSGGAPRVVWQTTESDPRTASARSLARQLNRDGAAPHLVWNPETGETVQLVPITRAAGGPAVGAVGLEPNRHGRLCAQIMVVGFTSRPFTAGPLHGLSAVMRWLESWGVTRRWPAGPPTGRVEPASQRHWAQGGHFGHSQVPGAQRTDPGPIDPQRITDFDVEVPRPRPEARPVPARIAFRP